MSLIPFVKPQSLDAILLLFMFKGASDMEFHIIVLICLFVTRGKFQFLIFKKNQSISIRIKWFAPLFFDEGHS